MQEFKGIETQILKEVDEKSSQEALNQKSTFKN
jgi:hypothetical protein